MIRLTTQECRFLHSQGTISRVRFTNPALRGKETIESSVKVLSLWMIIHWLLCPQCRSTRMQPARLSDKMIMLLNMVNPAVSGAHATHSTRGRAVCNASTPLTLNNQLPIPRASARITMSRAALWVSSIVRSSSIPPTTLMLLTRARSFKCQGTARPTAWRIPESAQLAVLVPRTSCQLMKTVSALTRSHHPQTRKDREKWRKRSLLTLSMSINMPMVKCATVLMK